MARVSRSRFRRGRGSTLLVLLRRLLRLLPLSYLPQRFWPVAVRDRSGHIVAEDARSSLPVRGLHAHALAEQGDEDLGLLVAVPGKRAETAVHLVGVVDALPDVGRIAAVVGDERFADLVDALAHRAREAVDGRLLAADRHELVDVHRRDLLRVEVPEPLLQRGGTGERPLHRHLLVEQHPDQQRVGVGVQQLVGCGVTGDVERSGHRSSNLARSVRVDTPAMGTPAHEPAIDSREEVTQGGVGPDRAMRVVVEVAARSRV